MYPDDAAVETPFFSIEEHEHHDGTLCSFIVCDDCYKDVFSSAKYINVIAYGYDENNNEVLGSKFFPDYPPNGFSFFTNIDDFEIPGKHIIGLTSPDILAAENLEKVVHAAAVDGIEPVGFYLLLRDDENTWYYKLGAYMNINTNTADTVDTDGTADMAEITADETRWYMRVDENGNTIDWYSDMLAEVLYDFGRNRAQINLNDLGDILIIAELQEGSDSVVTDKSFSVYNSSAAVIGNADVTISEGDMWIESEALGGTLIYTRAF